MSNFLLWQSAYTEFWYTDTLWPDFKEEHIIGAILTIRTETDDLRDLKLLKTRVASAAVAVFILIAVVCSGKTVVGISVFFVSIIAMYEYFKALENAAYRPIKPIGYISCLYILLICFDNISFNSLKLFQNMLSLEFMSMIIFLMLEALLSYTVFITQK